MPRICFIERSGVKHLVDVRSGLSIMQAALDHMVPGFTGDCGGSCMCASCHGYIGHQWIGKIGPASPNEGAMLDAAEYVLSNSRLTCQIDMCQELDGIVVRQAGPLVL